MEIKVNDATINRPQGERVLNAPFVFIDIDEYVKQLINEDAWQKNDRNSITVHKNDTITTVIVGLHEHAVINNNSVDGFINIQVIDGKIKMQVETEEMEMQKGQCVVLQKFINHSIEALQDSVLLLTTTES
jgi:quercetin dioxygenase-like cupin family protein